MVTVFPDPVLCCSRNFSTPAYNSSIKGIRHQSTAVQDTLPSSDAYRSLITGDSSEQLLHGIYLVRPWRQHSADAHASSDRCFHATSILGFLFHTLPFGDPCFLLQGRLIWLCRLRGPRPLRGLGERVDVEGLALGARHAHEPTGRQRNRRHEVCFLLPCVAR